MDAHRLYNDCESDGPSAEGPSAPKPLRPLEMDLDADRELERLRGLDGLLQDERWS